MEKAIASKVRLLLPVDVVVADEISEKASGEIVAVENIPSDKRIVDIGPRTIENFSEELRGCKTVFWNGPMGISEIPQFAAGTRVMAELMAGLDAVTVTGGGSTAEAVINAGLADKISFISTGGGAALSYLGGKKLPGLEALQTKDSA
jgi:phosphoglycerate kinase